MISKYGYSFVFSAACFAFVVTLFALFFIRGEILKTGIIVSSGVLFLFILYFFRDPVRLIPPGDHIVLSPADGKVIVLKKVWDDEFFRSEATQISIFLSPLNVHVNRIPITGKVRYFKYVKGEYLVAFHEEASEKNERAVIGIENGKFKVLMRQIAGSVARRIVCDLRMEESVKAGERFGMIKFGSRVDVLLPVEAELKVRLKDRVLGGETILAVVHS